MTVLYLTVLYCTVFHPKHDLSWFDDLPLLYRAFNNPYELRSEQDAHELAAARLQDYILSTHWPCFRRSMTKVPFAKQMLWFLHFSCIGSANVHAFFSHFLLILTRLEIILSDFEFLCLRQEILRYRWIYAAIGYGNNKNTIYIYEIYGVSLAVMSTYSRTDRKTYTKSDS